MAFFSGSADRQTDSKRDRWEGGNQHWKASNALADDGFSSSCTATPHYSILSCVFFISFSLLFLRGLSIKWRQLWILAASFNQDHLQKHGKSSTKGDETQQVWLQIGICKAHMKIHRMSADVFALLGLHSTKIICTHFFHTHNCNAIARWQQFL